MTTSTPRPAAGAPPTSDDGELTHRQIVTIIVGLMMGMFLGALDQTIVSTSIRTIADDLNGLSLQAWITTAYLITMTVTTPIYGKLGDNYGRKKLFMFAISVFIAGSALCSFAGSMGELAAFRAVQGMGAGGLFSLTLAIVGDIVPPRRRAKYMGYFMAAFGTSSVLGPVIGGFFAGREELLGTDGWRWVFLVNVPLGLAALLVIARTLRLDTVRREVPIDWWGATTLVLALAPLLVVAEQGREWGWGSPRSLACLAIGGAALVAYVLVERRMGEAALIPLRLFSIRAAAVTLAASVMIGAAMFGGILLLPLYMQIVHGATPTEAGLLMLPMVLGLMTASIGSGVLIGRTGRTRVFPIVGSSLIVVALLLLSLTTADTPLPLVSASMLVLGLGLGNCMQPLMITVQSSVAPSEIGVATSSATFFRQIGGTIGVAVFLSVLFGTVGGNIATALEQESRTPAFQAAVAQARQQPGSLDAQVARALSGKPGPDGGILARVQDDSSFIDRLDPALAHPFKAGFAQSMDLVFRLAAGAGVVAFLVLLLMPRVELRQSSAMAEKRAAAAAEA